MKPRQIDALIGRAVFGFEIIDHGEDCLYYKAPAGTCGDRCKDHEHMLPHYSTQIQDAWEIVEKMKEKEVHVNVLCCADGTFGCEIENRVYKGEPDTWFSGWKETAPLAICLAALSALGVSYE